MLRYISINNFLSEKGKEYSVITLSYELAGQSLSKAPIVIVNHALTGNSSVAGDDGWWGNLIGENKPVDTHKYCILAFNIPGNAYDSRESDDFEEFTLYDVARLFIQALNSLSINKVYAIMGASMGGSLTWQMAFLAPTLAQRILPIACDYKASDWLIAQTWIQKSILEHSYNPLKDARMHAMLCYRTPTSLNERFGLLKNRDAEKYDVEDWLEYHGDTLQKRFKLSAYKVMTFLTATIYVCDDASTLNIIQSDIHMISIDTDLLFTHDRALATFQTLSLSKANVTLNTIKSIHGHDAFLMEYQQLGNIIKPLF